MKKIYGIIGIFLLICLLLFLLPTKKNENLTKIKVAEVAHSIFYAPQYVAKELGFFEEEGLDVELILANGADKVTAAVLSDDVQIGFCGSEATIYVYNQGEKDYLVNFSGLTKRDGSFIVSRNKEDHFQLTDLIGKKVIGGRIGGMPEMTFEWVLKEAGINPKEVEIDTSIAFPAMGGSFIGGNGDYVNLFEPQATEVVKQGYGHIVASLGKLGGVVPYTAYHAKKSYLENNQTIIQGFTNAIQKGLDYVHTHTKEETAKIILPQFPDTSLKDLTTMVGHYQENDSWFETTSIKEQDFIHIQEIMENANELKKRVPYKDLVDTRFSK